MSVYFDEATHTYLHQGRVLPSVTQITGILDKPALIPWAVGCTVEHLKGRLEAGIPYSEAQIGNMLRDAERARFFVSDKALEIGSAVHEWLERHVKAQIQEGPSPALPERPAVRLAVEQYLAWEERQPDLRYLASERRLHSQTYDYCGTMDSLLELDGLLIVADFKTSKAIYPEYWLQVAGYAQAVEEEDGVKVDQLMIIRVPKMEGDSLEVQVSGMPVHQLVYLFNCCLDLCNWKLEQQAQWGGP